MTYGLDGRVYRFSTEGLDPSERFNAWRVQFSSLFDVVMEQESAVSYDSQFEASVLGRIVLGKRTWLHPSDRVTHSISRTERRIKEDGIDCYYVQLQIDEALRGDAGGKRFSAAPGSLLLLDMARPFDLIVTTGTFICLLLPRDMIDCGKSNPHGLVISGNTKSLLSEYVRLLGNHVSRLVDGEVNVITKTVIGLLSAVLTCQDGDDAGKTRKTSSDGAALRRRVKRYIEENLSDGDLSPGKICKEVGVSRASLYRLFLRDGGVMRVIQRKRLQNVRDTLASPMGQHGSIADVAWRHGFTNQKYFNRVFKAAFGYTPRETPKDDRRRLARSPLIDGISYTENKILNDWLRTFISF